MLPSATPRPLPVPISVRLHDRHGEQGVELGLSQFQQVGHRLDRQIQPGGDRRVVNALVAQAERHRIGRSQRRKGPRPGERRAR